MKAGGGGWRSDIFLNYSDWLRGCANLCIEEIRPAEVLFLKKWRKKFAFLSLHVRHPGEAFVNQVAIWNLYPSPKIYIKCWNRKKLGLGMPVALLNAASNVTHSSMASEDSSRVMTTTFKTHCTEHCMVEDFNVNFCESRLKVGTVPCRTVRMISRAGEQRTTTTCVRGGPNIWSALGTSRKRAGSSCWGFPSTASWAMNTISIEQPYAQPNASISSGRQLWYCVLGVVPLSTRGLSDLWWSTAHLCGSARPPHTSTSSIECSSERLKSSVRLVPYNTNAACPPDCGRGNVHV